MEVADIIAGNLKKLQQEFNLNQTELGEIIGVTRQTFAKYLDGQRVMDSGKLYKLAKYFNKDFDYFLNLNSKKEDLLFKFRIDDLKNNFSEKIKDEITDKFKLYHEIIELSDNPIKNYLPEEYNLKIEDNILNKKEKAAVEKIAEKQRRYLGVDDALNINIFTLFEENNINVIAQKISDNNLAAVSAYSKEKGAYIFINDSREISEERKIFAAVQELGHLILHRDQYTKDIGKAKFAKSYLKDIRDKVAEHFAVAFLVPAKVLSNYDYYFDGYLDLDLIFEKKKEFGVSAKTLIMTLNKYGYLDNKILEALLKKLKEAGYESQEPEAKDYIRKNEKLLALVRRLLISEKISIKKAAEVLNISVSEMNKLLEKWKNYEYRTA